MKNGFLHELKRSVRLFLWLLLVHTALGAVVLPVAALALLVLGLSGSLVLGGSGLTLLGSLACALPGGLLLVLAGWKTPDAARPNRVGAGIVLALWAALTSLLQNAAGLFLLPQALCGELAEALLELALPDGRLEDFWRMSVGCVLAVLLFGVGLALRTEKNGDSPKADAAFQKEGGK